MEMVIGPRMHHSVTPVENGSGINNDSPRWCSVPAAVRRSILGQPGTRSVLRSRTISREQAFGPLTVVTDW